MHSVRRQRSKWKDVDDFKSTHCINTNRLHCTSERAIVFYSDGMFLFTMYLCTAQLSAKSRRILIISPTSFTSIHFCASKATL